MNFPEFEFITPGHAAIKEEIESDYFEETVEMEPDMLDRDEYEIKCGKIMISTRRNLTLVCAFCNDEFDDMHSFGNHLHAKHFVDDSGEVPSIETTPEERHEEVLASNFADDSIIEGLPNDRKTALQPNFICKTCKRNFKSSAALSSHETLHNAQPSFDMENECITDETGETRTNASSSPEPPEPLSDPNLFCELCDRQFKSRGALREHATRHGNTIPLALQRDPSYLTCKFCNREFSEAIERISHEFGHSAGQRFECKHCSKSFQSSNQRRTHMFSHTGERPYKCKICPKAYTTAVNLVRHERDHLGIKPYSCEICRKRFVRNWDRLTHLRSHTRERPYKCELCGQGFTTSSLLCVHRRRHTNTRNHKCDVCGVAFFRADQLKFHQITHTKLRPFQCDICGITFSRKTTLETHQKLHLEFKQFVCDICGKEFAQKVGLNCHKKSHDEEMIGNNRTSARRKHLVLDLKFIIRLSPGIEGHEHEHEH